MPAKPCRWRALYLALPLMVFLCGTSPAAKAVVPGTDANVVTAIDVSDSISRYEEWLQQTGLVRALVHPDFLRAATAGPRRRIGFAVFTWSSDGKFDLLALDRHRLGRGRRARVSGARFGDAHRPDPLRRRRYGARPRRRR
ncbi:DUF1194 domain-containing protein [Mesorhizobium sp. M6A.T.Ce.TU.002.03.1.1]|nr:DUF1194 domain-containing protein [Mesorhizobium sp. M6A.T.Ce.TU.002.03.1.1]